jgi:hypothetical protein
MECLSTGVLEYWRVGVLEYWSDGVLQLLECLSALIAKGRTVGRLSARLRQARLWG